ncbi:hypothetical protein C1I92_02795 [Jiangella anatolica]|uniref:C2H2-type domain-containing protein n=2 Tax=Jiangella anatolica TaxID=2670374 RepID=A0A2W2C074_9ACTN|nr:hypothetical protein C1I92_02795 [Jiangella anatolica]
MRGGDAVEVLDRLRRAGHTVYTCRGGERCALAIGGTCPLADHMADVLVHVRERPDPPVDRDRPFLCATVAEVPTVLCGYPSVEGPWTRADAHCSPTGVVDAAAKAVRPTSATAHRRVRQAVADVLRPHGLRSPRRLEISADHDVIEVSLMFERPVPVRVREELRPAIRAALAALSRYWAVARVTILAGTPAPTAGSARTPR